LVSFAVTAIDILPIWLIDGNPLVIIVKLVPSTDLKKLVLVHANNVVGFNGLNSTSLKTPLLTFVQLAPESSVFHKPLLVATYKTAGLLGFIIILFITLDWEVDQFSPVGCHVFPPSNDLITPIL